MFNGNNKDQEVDNTKRTILFFDVDSYTSSIVVPVLKSDTLEVIEEKSVAPAMRAIKKHDVDIVVAGFRPVSTDILKLMHDVKKKHPSVTRVLLCESEHESKVITLILKGYANNYFEIPHGLGDIAGRIEHIIHIRRILQSKKLLNFLSDIEDLSTYLKTFIEFRDAISQDESTKKIAGIIEKDVSIAARVLKIANSAFYSTSKIGSIERACIYLGLNTIKDIVFAASLVQPQKLSSSVNNIFERVVHHSLKVNQNFQRFYKLETGETLPESYSSVGITHDIGKIILLQCMPKQYKKIIKYQNTDHDLTFYRSEIELGFEGQTHAEIGAYFLDLWNFPEPSINAALFHHTPDEAYGADNKFMDIFSFVNDFAR